MSDLRAAILAGRGIDAAYGQRQGIRPHPPATLEAVGDAEAKLGFVLPELLRRIYLEVGNGGFGPGYGLIGVPGGATDDAGCSVVEKWFHARHDAATHPRLKKRRPDYRLLPCVYCGCTSYLCLSCQFPDGPMWVYEQGARAKAKKFGVQTFPLSSLLRSWVEGSQDA